MDRRQWNGTLALVLLPEFFLASIDFGFWMLNRYLGR
jgi:hypothetical protein